MDILLLLASTTLAGLAIIAIATDCLTYRRLVRATAREALRSRAYCLVLNDRMASDDVRRRA